MDYNYIYFHLQKLQLGSIDAACQELQYPLKNSARAIFSLFSPVRWQGVEEDEDPVPGEKQCANVEVWFLEDDGGSSMHEFHFDAYDYGRVVNWVLRDVLDNAYGDALYCDHAGGST